MRRKILDVCMATSPAKGGLDLSAALSLSLVWLAVGPSKNGALAVVKRRELCDDPRVQGHAARFAVLRIVKLNVLPRELDIAPVEVESLGEPGARIEQEN